MCGIVGIYTKRGIADAETIRAMTSVLVHRGPMDDGYLFGANVGLGMRRLSIIDIEGGHQPVYNEDRSIGVILNGEIYNYRELRIELIARGHRFYTMSDTEVIVHLYEEMGEAFLSLLNGMFAIALWDERAQRLLLARDRLGVKPLYYYEDAERLAFASELKALLQCRFVPRDIDLEAISDYLTLMYIRAPRSPFKAIRKLLPGHYLVIDASGARLVRYWDLREHCEPTSLNEPALIEHIRWLLEDSVRLRMRSDVPVGAFLSGGIDSSTVVAYASANSPQPLDTFAVGFEGADFDELGYARIVAKAFRTRHHETVVTVEDTIRHLPKLVWHLDEPNADSAIIPTYLVSKFAATKLRVVLTGLGGDELFGGYPRYFDGYPIEHAYRRIPGALRQNLLAPLARVLPSRIAGRIEWNSLADEERYLMQVSYLLPSERQALLSHAVNGEVSLREEFRAYPGIDRINRLMFVDAITYLPDDILHITDRMSMAVSLEARTPFLDYRLVEFCAGMPGSHKIHRASRGWKVILKKTMGPILPEAIVRRPKWGFGAPVVTWMNMGLLPVLKDLYRSSEAVAIGLLDRAGTQRLIESWGKALKNYRSAHKLWMLLVLEVWCRVFLGKNAGKSPCFALDDLR